ncbi:nucleotidyltransferase family protein [Desulfobacterales bacterium HSG2]|nr:nucleotidyltransferase family protein [Desulfobacterales bacterium HSG2]
MKISINERNRIIQQIRDFFSGTDACRVSVFGSFARNETHSLSDVDLLMEVSEPVGYLKIIEYKLALEKMLRRKVDLLTPDGISPKIRPHIYKELTLIYENTRQNPR